MGCRVDTNDICSGRNAISIYEISGYAGCFTDSIRERVLTGDLRKDDPPMTSEVSLETIPRICDKPTVSFGQII